VDLSLERADHPRSPLPSSDQAGWEGYRLLAGIRSAGIPAVVVSGVANPGEIEQIYREQGIFSFIEKQSFDRDVFISTVEDALQAARQAQQARSQLHELTARELEVLEMIAHGATNKEIAEALVITPNTVKRHLKSIFQKLEIHTRSAAAAMAAGWFGSSGEDRG
jgi:RNA polymerase sigma factor (sigma-70 family)